ncbi:LPS assembly lipoprotein LptE [Novosphingobium sp. KACC 22771]|uniref:LPS assembly lipoprotein LptE n=1 Tax=Novosphingobium sp. KACC 22771 TaxID=3025670 RepID=UPI002365ED27|nr:LPS assembly lipoprotein LptE [Novosphingobium sp. KACC 22771]WDF72848.1 LPS assembly lipoprotein LptE [Novosphingobium sp. KACC 22771]
MRRLLPLCLLAMLPALQGCALQPLYAGGGQASVAQGLGSISVSPIQGKAGWLMQNALVDQLGAVPEGTAPRYRLEVRLNDQLLGLGLLSNNTVGRERRILRARYQLVDAASGEVLLDATAGSDAGLDVVSSEYATVAAEQTALENLTRAVASRIVTNLAVKLRARR